MEQADGACRFRGMSGSGHFYVADRMHEKHGGHPALPFHDDTAKHRSQMSYNSSTWSYEAMMQTMASTVIVILLLLHYYHYGGGQPLALAGQGTRWTRLSFI